MKFDSYSLISRLLPAVISSVPFLVVHYFLLNPYLGQFWGDLLALRFVSDITLASALLFLLIQSSRVVSKEFFENRIFNRGLNFPTTDFLLHTNRNFSPEYTKKIHEKIKKDFGIMIPSYREEVKNKRHSRRCILEAMGHIRVRVKKGYLVGQHNAGYGFARNLAGGAIVAASMSFINLILFRWFYPISIASVASLLTLLFYSLLSVSSKKMIESESKSYARVLIQEYMGT